MTNVWNRSIMLVMTCATLTGLAVSPATAAGELVEDEALEAAAPAAPVGIDPSWMHYILSTDPRTNPAVFVDGVPHVRGPSGELMSLIEPFAPGDDAGPVDDHGNESYKKECWWVSDNTYRCCYTYESGMKDCYDHSYSCRKTGGYHWSCGWTVTHSSHAC